MSIGRVRVPYPPLKSIYICDARLFKGMYECEVCWTSTSTPHSAARSGRTMCVLQDSHDILHYYLQFIVRHLRHTLSQLYIFYWLWTRNSSAFSGASSHPRRFLFLHIFLHTPSHPSSQPSPASYSLLALGEGLLRLPLVLPHTPRTPSSTHFHTLPRSALHPVLVVGQGLLRLPLVFIHTLTGLHLHFSTPQLYILYWLWAKDFFGFLYCATHYAQLDSKDKNQTDPSSILSRVWGAFAGGLMMMTSLVTIPARVIAQTMVVLTAVMSSAYVFNLISWMVRLSPPHLI